LNAKNPLLIFNFMVTFAPEREGGSLFAVRAGPDAQRDFCVAGIVGFSSARAELNADLQNAGSCEWLKK